MKIKRKRQWGAIGLILAMSLNQITPVLAAIEETVVVCENIEGQLNASSSNA